MKLHRRKLHQFIILITLPLVMWLFFNQVAFWHYHILENGVVVEHAHPFKNSTKPNTPYQNHHHSDFEYSVLAQLSFAAAILMTSVLLGFLWNEYLKKGSNFYLTPIISRPAYSLALLRAPPAVY